MARPRKAQQPDLIEQSIRLTPKIEVVIRAPESQWPHIVWDGKYVAINADPQRPVQRLDKLNTLLAIAEPVPDTPAEAEARRVLEERFPKAAAIPFRTEDVANPLGVELTAENLLAMAGPVGD